MFKGTACNTGLCLEICSLTNVIEQQNTTRIARNSWNFSRIGGF
jgi:hypothetical protein